jgi:magnesium chelatase family protein
MIQRYMQKISGPLMDRIDIHIDVPAVNYKEMRAGTDPEGRRRFASAFCVHARSNGTDLAQRALFDRDTR